MGLILEKSLFGVTYRHPEIHFSYSCFSDWKRDNIKSEELAKDSRTFWEKIKEATGYSWDNEHYLVDNIFGKAVMTISFYPDKVALWDYATGGSLGDYSLDDVDVLEEIIDKLTKGLVKCCECGGWFEPNKIKSFSFAGKVCNKCYNPKLHLPPDTHGD